MYLKPFAFAARLTSALSLKEIYLKILTKHGWSRNAWIECLIHRARIEIPKFVVSPRKSSNPEENPQTNRLDRSSGDFNKRRYQGHPHGDAPLSGDGEGKDQHMQSNSRQGKGVFWGKQ